jgi:hypothetical protein
MSRTQESGAYLGGIGAMLDLADVCPACGLGHPEPQFAILHGAPRECPRVVMGSFPVVTEPGLEATSLAPASQRIVQYEFPTMPVAPAVALGSVPVSRRDYEGSRSRGLSMPWLPPPDLGEVI